MLRLTIIPLALLAACDRSATSTPAEAVQASADAVDRVDPDSAVPAPTASTRDLSGRWVGVEGLVLDVAATTPGAYRLAMQYDLDHNGVFTGRAQNGAIAFERDGRLLILRPTDGAATGLKYLAAKKDCLTVASGEGYCRD